MLSWVVRVARTVICSATRHPHSRSRNRLSQRNKIHRSPIPCWARAVSHFSSSRPLDTNVLDRSFCLRRSCCAATEILSTPVIQRTPIIHAVFDGEHAWTLNDNRETFLKNTMFLCSKNDSYSVAYQREREREIKLQQTARSCSQNIYNMFNVMRRTSELESQVILTRH